MGLQAKNGLICAPAGERDGVSLKPGYVRRINTEGYVGVPEPALEYI